MRGTSRCPTRGCAPPRAPATARTISGRPIRATGSTTRTTTSST
jgi:hypothetical protein